MPPDETAEPLLAPPRGAEDADFDQQAIVRQLEEELAAMKEDLQTTLEQLETSNEEFKTAHEELLSMNEELQSTNEELETSKEELQSLNEELSTVNSQLGNKVEELEKKHADLENLMAATDVATICWSGPDGSLVHSAAQKIVRLKPADKGVPLAISHMTLSIVIS